uniref:Uncharacterized protein n=1 Tax=Anopheles culicifacies TaxID=139723 RepID=A0A182M8B7_9DIPT
MCRYSRSSSTTVSVIQNHTLQVVRIFRDLPCSFHRTGKRAVGKRVVPTGIVVGGIFLASNQVLRIEQFTDLSKLQLIWVLESETKREHTSVTKARTDYLSPSVRTLGERSITGILFICYPLSILSNAVLQTVLCPDCFPHLYTCLSDVDGQCFTITSWLVELVYRLALQCAQLMSLLNTKNFICRRSERMP